MKAIAILGSTGSIGRQTLEIVRAHPDRLRVVALAAGRANPSLLAEQVREFRPELVAVPDDETARELTELIAGEPGALTIETGSEGLITAAAHTRAETVVTGVVGTLGLLPTAAAVRAGKTIALANKETLVAAGSAIMPMARRHGARIVPVDSEHSAIFQSLSGWESGDVRSIWLTGSGGPFRTWTREQMGRATIGDALKHPNWSMGPKITIDSATLMNKGLEVIEARWLFDIPPARIRVVIHPQSVLHSAVEFVDGSVVGQMGLPDMRLPIHFALFYPERVASEQVPPLDLVKLASLTFEEPDLERFPCLALARAAAADDGTVACVLNAANEVAVDAFLKGAIKFADIARYIEKVLERHVVVSKPSLEDILRADEWARATCLELMGALAHKPS